MRLYSQSLYILGLLSFLTLGALLTYSSFVFLKYKLYFVFYLTKTYLLLHILYFNISIFFFSISHSEHNVLYIYNVYNISGSETYKKISCCISSRFMPIKIWVKSINPLARNSPVWGWHPFIHSNIHFHFFILIWVIAVSIHITHVTF